MKERLTLLRTIATEISRILAENPATRPERRRTAILDYIRERMAGKVSVPQLARQLHLSPSRTAHLVRELFNTPLPLLARQVKLHEAARQLRATDLPVGEVGRALGFEDQNYFSRVFSEAFGVSPRVYRKTRPTEA